MLVIPAIDIRGGRCVRLRQGDYNRETVYSRDPAAVAASFEAQGAELVHVVDLDGARAGRPVNLEALRRVTGAVTVPVQFGGGLRDDTAVAEAIVSGVDRLILGSAACLNPGWALAVARRYPGRVLASLDARGGKVAVRGWAEDTEVAVAEAARRLMDGGIGEFVYTDIARDGLGSGPDVEGVRALVALGCRVIASGGVARLDDLRRLAAAGARAAIVGRALYDGQVGLPEAIAVAV